MRVATLLSGNPLILVLDLTLRFTGPYKATISGWFVLPLAVLMIIFSPVLMRRFFAFDPKTHAKQPR
jgi:hypothetical protein